MTTSAPRPSAIAAALAFPAFAQTTIKAALNADIRSINPGVNRDDSTDTVILHIVEGRDEVSCGRGLRGQHQEIRPGERIVERNDEGTVSLNR